ncbi:MAG: helix-turn-helix domain-containing protein [Chloroflexota bacterium]
MREATLGELLTLEAAAARFQVKRDRLRRATLEGRLRAVKLGSRRTHPWLVRPDDVAAYLRDTRKGPKPKRPTTARQDGDAVPDAAPTEQQSAPKEQAARGA